MASIEYRLVDSSNTIDTKQTQAIIALGQHVLIIRRWYERISRVACWERNASGDVPLTPSPANPGNLSSPWKCTSFACQKAYGEPFYVLRETWENDGDWTMTKEEREVI